MDPKKTRIPIVNEDIVDLLTKEPLAAKELYATREEMVENNYSLIALLESYISTIPEEHHRSAVSAAVFTYYVLRKQEEYDSELAPEINGPVN
jgi:hypothetical protein